MSVLYCDNDTDVIVDALQLADDFSFITDAELAVSFCSQAVGDKGEITGATNVAQIVITSVAHGLTTGDVVVITGVEGNLAANGPQAVTVLTADTFRLDGTAGTGAYTEGGMWYLGIEGATDIALDYSSTRKRYRGVVPGTVPFIAGTTYLRFILCENYNLHWEDTVLAQIRR